MKQIMAFFLAVLVLASVSIPAQADGLLDLKSGLGKPENGATAPASNAVMSHEEYMAAELESPVCVETYVQACQSWWDNKITVYAQSEDGAYFLYNMECSQEDAQKLVPGTKIRVTGYKSEWAGEIEIVDATFEILPGEYLASATDLTDLVGSEELVAYQNVFACFKGMTVASIAYKNNEPGDDIYVTLEKNGELLEFCVEAYLTGPDTAVYNAVGSLRAGDVVDVEGFLYWYNGPNTHITSVFSAKEDAGEGLRDKLVRAIVGTLTLKHTDITIARRGLFITLELEGGIAPEDVKWSSSDTSVATVYDGNVTSVGGGVCVITAEYHGLIAQCVVRCKF